MKNIIGIILYLIIIVVGAGAISDIVDLIVKNKLNNILILLIKGALIFIILMLLSKTKTMKEFEKSLFEKPKNKK